MSKGVIESRPSRTLLVRRPIVPVQGRIWALESAPCRGQKEKTHHETIPQTRRHRR